MRMSAWCIDIRDGADHSPGALSAPASTWGTWQTHSSGSYQNSAKPIMGTQKDSRWMTRSMNDSGLIMGFWHGLLWVPFWDFPKVMIEDDWHDVNKVSISMPALWSLLRNIRSLCSIFLPQSFQEGIERKRLLNSKLKGKKTVME